jgi:hypothetical protein
VAKLNWEKRSRYEKIDHYAEAVEKNKSKRKTIHDLNLGEHKNHTLQVVMTPKGPHKGKVICVDCDGKFVTWIPKGFIE